MAKPEHPVSAPVSLGRQLARRSFLRGTVGLALGASLAAPGRGLAAARGSGTLDLGKLRPYWNEIPGSAMLPALYTADQVPPGVWGTGGPNANVYIWSGAAYDRKRRAMLCGLGGNHNAYWGNEFYEFSLETLKWRRTCDTSAIGTVSTAGMPITMANGPMARHTYMGIEALDDFGKVLIGGMFDNPSVAIYDEATASYDPPDPKLAGAMLHIHYIAEIKKAAMFNMWDRAYYLYDPATKVVSRVAVFNWQFPAYGPSAYSVEKKKIVFFNSGALDIIDVADPYHPTRSGWTLIAGRQPGSGQQPNYPYVANPFTGPWPWVFPWEPWGVNYHPPSGKFMCWDGKQTVGSFDLDKLTFTVIPNPAGMALPPTSPYSNGVFGKWRYVPEIDAFLGFNTHDRNMWIYKMPS